MPQSNTDLSRHSAEELSATAAGAALTAPDPMVAAVEMVKAAEAELDATIAEWSDVEKVLGDQQCGNPHDDPRWIDCEQRVFAAFDTFYARSRDLLGTSATTFAGASALLRYAAEKPREWRDDNGIYLPVAICRHATQAIHGFAHRPARARAAPRHVH
jgi:hypothetical protein